MKDNDVMTLTFIQKIVKFNFVITLKTSWFHKHSSYTVNMIISAGGKFCKNAVKIFHMGGNFHDTSHISLIKSYGVYFRVGEIFAEKAILRKTPKLAPRENFHVYSNSFTNNLHQKPLIV